MARGHDYRKGAKLSMDSYGRLLPAPNRFPSTENENGFKPIAQYIHSKGLKFGIHLMRGIPRQAVDQNTPVLGTDFHAADIADKSSICKWNTDMYGVDMSKPGAQEYYNSVFNLLASWEVDFVKVDDLSRPYKDHIKEIEAIRKAIDQTGRPMVLSTSPGETPLDVADHVSNHANMWRISDDFWDDWKALKEQFTRCRNWAKTTGPGHWPDADMLPFGAVRQDRPTGWTHFTKDEQITCMTLWCISRSPLIMGGHMPKNDEFTLSLLTNDEVIAVDQHSQNGRELSSKDGLVVWVADVPNSPDKYVALFNTKDAENAVRVSFSDAGLPASCKVRDLWKKQDVGPYTSVYSQAFLAHSSGLFRIGPGN
jgi:hypothetical protein